VGGQITAGQIVGAVVGAVVGFFVGGPMGAMYGAVLGYGIGGMVDPPKGPEQEIDIKDIQYNTFQRNLPVAIIYGRNRVFGNLIWIGNTGVSTHTGGGGKGGGPPPQETAEYSADFAVALGEGQIERVVEVYIDNDKSAPEEGVHWGAYLGAPDQSPHPSVVTYSGPNPPAWANTAYIYCSGSLGPMNRIPIISAVVDGIPGSMTSGFTLGTFDDFGASPFSVDLLNGVVYPKWYKPPFEDGELAAAGIGGGNISFKLWTEDDGWVTKGTYSGTPESISNTQIAHFAGSWYTWSDWPPNIIYSSDLITFLAMASNTWGPGTNFKRVRGIASTGESGVLVWAAYFGAPANIHLYIMDALIGISDFTVAIGSIQYTDNPGGNGFGVVSQGFIKRAIIFTTGGNILISSELKKAFENDWETVDFSSYGSFAHSNCWTVASNGPNAYSFYFIARNNSSVVTLFRCSFDGVVEELAPVGTTDTSIRITGLHYLNGRLFVGTNIMDANYNKFFGYYDESADEWIWPHTPSVGSPDADPNWYSGSADNVLFPQGNYLRGFACDKIDGTHTRWELQCPFTPSELNNSPAVSIYDFLTNTRYGMGIPTTKIDTDSFVEAHNYCVALVNGEPRFNLDIILGSHKSALDHLVMMLQSFGGFLVWSEGVIKLKVDKAESSIASLTEDDIISDSFQYTLPSLKDIPNRIKADFRDKDDEYRHSYVYVNDEFNQDQTGEIRDLQIQLLGVTRKSQAARLAQYYLDNASINRIICVFRVSIKHIRFEVGDVIDITHSLPDWTNKYFRIMEISEQEDDELHITCREYNEDIFHDLEAATQVNTESYMPTLFEPPEHVVLLDAYEKPTALAEISISFGIPTDPGWWLGAQIFKSVGDNLNYEHIGTSRSISEVGQVEGDISSSDSVINVRNIYGAFTNTGTLIIGDEELTYEAFVDDGDDTGRFTGCIRGQNNTVAAAHTDNSVLTLKATTFIYGYDSVAELNQTLYFKALSVNSKGVAATPSESAPEVSVIPVGKYKMTLPVNNLEINEQGNNKYLANYEDVKISWRGTNRFSGYGKIAYGTHELGYGGGGVEEAFVSFQLEIIDVGGTVKRIVQTTSESWIYTAAMRVEDNLASVSNFTIRVRQKSAFNLSPSIELEVNS
jgi:hypothetical protein